MTIINHNEPSVTNAKQSRYVGGRQFHNDPKSVYILAKDDIEKNRLRQQHLWIRETFGLLAQPQILAPLFEKEIDVCDVGCGTGSWILDMAAEYPQAQYYGSDLTDMFPQSDYPENCHFAFGNVLEDNPFGKKFDFVQMRYFAVALRKEEWDQAFFSIYKQLKPGGYFQIMEPSITMNSTNSELNEVCFAFRSLVESKGQDSDVPPTVVGKLKSSGFDVVYDNMIATPIGWGNTLSVQGAHGMRTLYLSIASDLADQLNIDVESCKVKINQGCDSMGPTQTTVNQWCFLARKPLDS